MKAIIIGLVGLVVVSGVGFCEEGTDAGNRFTGLVEVNPPGPAPKDSLIAIRGVTLVDGRGGPPIENSVVIIKGPKLRPLEEETSSRFPRTHESSTAAVKPYCPVCWTRTYTSAKTPRR